MTAINMASVKAIFPSSDSTIATALICMIIFVLLSVVVRGLRRQFLLPPGPLFLQLTILRNMMKKTTPSRLERIYLEQSKKYGKIFSFRLGRDIMVVLSDPAIIHEAFIKQRGAFNNRRGPSAYAMSLGGEHEHRIIFGNGRLWQSARRLVSPCLKNVGSWGQQMEGIIVQEADFLTDKLATFDSLPFDPRDHITLAIANIIYSLVHGHRLDYDDPRLEELTEAVSVVTSHPLNTNDALRYLPFLFYFPRARPLRQGFETMKRIMTTAVSRQSRSYDRSNIKTIIERIILAAEEEIEQGDGVLQTREIWRLLFDLISAGSDTTANTIKWAVLAMAHYPDIQKKIHGEINRTLRDRCLCSKDQRAMPFTQATLMEVLRYRPVAPLAVPHVASHTAVLRGYTIPKGSMVIANIWSCHHDPDLWDDPEVFNPERFLSEDQQTLGKAPAAFIPFSVGSRMCVGDQLAKTELFLIFTRIMQRFNVDFAPGERPEVFDEGLATGFIMHPNDMSIRMTPRPVTKSEI